MPNEEVIKYLIESLKEASFWVLIVISFASSILLAEVAWPFKNIFGFKNKLERTNKYIDEGLLCFACAIFLWSISAIISKFITGDCSDSDKYMVTSGFSSMNNLFFLVGINYFEYKPKWIKNNKKTKLLCVVLCVLTIIITNILHKFSEKENLATLAIPDFLLSITTAILLMFTLAKTFWKRDLLVLSVFSIITLLVVLFNQTLIHELLQNKDNVIIILLGLCSRLSLIIILCLIAFSYAQKNYSTEYQKVNVLTEKIDTIDLAWQEIAYNAFHKIGNPITAIENFTKSIEKRIKDRTYDDVLPILINLKGSIDDSKKVLNEFNSLTISNRRYLQQSNIVKIIRQSIRFITEYPSIKISYEILNNNSIPDAIRYKKNQSSSSANAQDDAVYICIDQIKIKECFDELIANSLRFFPQGKTEKRITINIEYIDTNIPLLLDHKRKYIKITYLDNGLGIPDDNKTKIFTPFFTTKRKGNGLGLSIVRKIIELHEGMIIENGKYGSGVRFEIYIPVDLKNK
jgi:signal transduction histidine kinase